MELKDLVLTTLQELDENIEKETYIDSTKVEDSVEISEERDFLLHSKERLEVLFAGLNSDDCKKVEAKLDLVINFLQFYLSQVDSRLEKL